MAACRVVAASDAAALRASDGGKRRLSPPGSEKRALKVAAAMVAIAIAGLPAEEPRPVGGEGGADEVVGGGEEEVEAADVSLAKRFMEGKRSLCSLALRSLADEIKEAEAKAQAQLRSGSKGGKGGSKRKGARGGKRGGGPKQRPAGGSRGFG